MKKLLFFLIDITIWFFGKIVYLFYFLFGWRFVCLTGRLLGNLMYCTDKKKRNTTKTELAALFGHRFTPEEIDDITRRSFTIYYKRQVETSFLGAFTQERMNNIMHVEGIENLDNALSKGKGIILLLSHFGSFLLPLPYLGYRGYKINQVTGKQIHVSRIAERFWSWRKREADRLPVRFLQVGKFLRPVFDALDRNEIVAIAFDGRDGKKWIEVDLFERKVLFSTGPFELARRTGATIIPTFVIRDTNDIQKLVLEPAFTLSADSDIKMALSSDTRRFAEHFAEYIAAYPCHFGMILFIMRQLQKEGAAHPFYSEA